MRNIIVNNPAAKEGGALTILEGFLEKISTLKCNRRFYIIVSLSELTKYQNDKIKIFVIKSQGLKDRILWDNFKLKKFLQKNKIKPDLFLSIQNTGVNINKKIPQIIYYHQLISLCKNNWNICDKEERIYWKYEKLYPFFIKQYLKRAKSIVVQTEWVKKKFSDKFKFPLEKIFVEKPILEVENIEKIKKISKEKIRLFYPAMPLIYKNHEIIIKALGKLKKENFKLNENLECIFTFLEEESDRLDQLIKKNNLCDVIKLVGKLEHKKVLEYYKNSDLLIFPSYIETLGLPLLEAQIFNLTILVIDLEYSREALKGYSNVIFFKNEYDELYKKLKKELKNVKNDRK